MIIRDLIRGILIEYEGKKLTRRIIENAILRISTALSMIRHDEMAKELPESTKSTLPEKQEVVILPPIPVSTGIDTNRITIKDNPPVDIKATAEMVQTDKHKAVVMTPPKRPTTNKAIIAMPVGSLGESIDPKTGEIGRAHV